MKPPPALNAAILVTVRPAPASTVYSAKILQQLHDQPACQTYRAVFESADAAARAIDASPLTVNAFHNTPSPRALDPFNVFGWHHRKEPHPYTFICELAVANGELDQLPDYPSAHLLVTHTHEPSSSLRQGLVDAGAPLNLIHGLSTALPTPANTAWTKEQDTGTDSSKQPLPPVRKFLTGPRLRKMWSKSATDT
ncbi:hypothetical protein DV735_g4086, partial [Chaetothyriales sp. CBS 134920]